MIPHVAHWPRLRYHAQVVKTKGICGTLFLFVSLSQIPTTVIPKFPMNPIWWYLIRFLLLMTKHFWISEKCKLFLTGITIMCSKFILFTSGKRERQVLRRLQGGQGRSSGWRWQSGRRALENFRKSCWTCLNELFSVTTLKMLPCNLYFNSAWKHSWITNLILNAVCSEKKKS